MVYRFEEIEIDDTRRELRRGGVPVGVEPKVFDLIVYLVRNRALVVSKEDLLEALWPGQAVQESAVNVFIHRARQALAGAAGRNVIRNFPRRGYRFVAVLDEPPASLPPAPPRGVRRLVGREAELARVLAALDASRGSTAHLVLLTGEAGIGKTRLLEEVRDAARARGVEVLWAQGDPRGQSPAFALWREVLLAFAARHDDAALAAAFGPAAAELACLAPTLRDRLGAGDRVVQETSARQRGALFDAVAAFVRRAAAERPLLLIVDNIHGADPDSRDLLAHVLAALQSVPLLVAAADRVLPCCTVAPADGRPCAVVQLLHQSTAGGRVDMEALGDADVLALLEQVAGGPVPAAVCATVVDSAGGNPLVVREYWRYLVAQGLVESSPAGWVSRGDPAAVDLPGGVRSVVQNRCAELGPQRRAVLAVAALLGREFSVAELAAACHASPADVRRDLAEALRLRVLARGAGPDGYRFPHAAFPEHLTDELGDHERRVMHRRIGAAIERLYGTEDDRRLPELAHHFSAGANRESAERAMDYAQRLANQQFAALGFHGAARSLERAVELLDAYHPEQATRRFGLLIGLGDTLVRAGDEAGARRAFHAAAAEQAATDAAAPPGAAVTPVEVDRLLSFVRAALAVVADPDWDAWREAGADREWAMRAVAAHARQLGDASGLAAALVSQRWIASARALPESRLRLSTEAVFLAEQSPAVHLLQEARLLRIHDLLENGRLTEADAQIAAFTQLAAGHDVPAYRWIAAYLRAMRAQLDGRLAEAERLAQAALQAAAPAFGDLAATFMSGQLTSIRAYQGRMGEMVGLLELFAERYPRNPSGHANVASVYCELGRLEEARQALARAMEAGLHAGPFRAVVVPHTAAALARACVTLGAAREAAVLYEALLPWAGTFLVSPLAVACVGPADAFLGPLAQSAGRWPAAARHYEAALTACERIGSRAVCAHVQYEFARGLLRRGRQGQRRAWALLEDAAAVAQELELTGLAAWIDSARRGSPSRGREPVVDSSGVV